MLEYKDINYKIGENEILKNINFQLENNKITSIIGPNGSGKSTIIKLLSLPKKEYTGNIIYENEQYDFKNDYSKISVLKQFTSLPKDLTCQQFLELCYQSAHSLFYKITQEDRQKISEKKAMCDCNSISDKKLGELSGGQRQRVLICAAILREPQVLILDEPATFLDVKYQHVVMELIKKLNKEQGVTILLVLHDINQAIQLSDNIILLKDGKITYDGLSSEIEEENLNECFEIKFKRHFKHFITEIK